MPFEMQELIKTEKLPYDDQFLYSEEFEQLEAKIEDMVEKLGGPKRTCMVMQGYRAGMTH